MCCAVSGKTNERLGLATASALLTFRSDRRSWNSRDGPSAEATSYQRLSSFTCRRLRVSLGRNQLRMAGGWGALETRQAGVVRPGHISKFEMIARTFAVRYRNPGRNRLVALDGGDGDEDSQRLAWPARGRGQTGDGTASPFSPTIEARSLHLYHCDSHECSGSVEFLGFYLETRLLSDDVRPASSSMSTALTVSQWCTHLASVMRSRASRCQQCRRR